VLFLSPAFWSIIVLPVAHLFLDLVLFLLPNGSLNLVSSSFFLIGPANPPLLFFLISIDNRVSFNEDYVTAPRTSRHMNLFFVFPE
jgi:hypothetical protein